MGWYTQGEAIIARLQSEAPALATVGWASDLAGIEDVAKLAPSAWVQPGGQSRADDSHRGRVAAANRRWIVTVSVVSDGAIPIEAMADPLLSAVRGALMGWAPMLGAPDVARERMAWLEDSEPYFEAGYAEFPLVFVLPVLERGT